MKKMSKILALLTAGALLFGCMFTSCSNGSSGDENGGGSGNGTNTVDNTYIFYDEEVTYTNPQGNQETSQLIYVFRLKSDGTYECDIEEKYSGQKRENYASGNYEIKGTTFIMMGTNSEGNPYKNYFLIGENNILTHYADKTYSLTISSGGVTVKYDFKTKADGTFEAYLEGKTQKISFGTFYIDGSTLISKNREGEIIAYTIGENDTLTMIIPPEEE